MSLPLPLLPRHHRSFSLLSHPSAYCPLLALPPFNYLCHHPSMQPANVIRSAPFLSFPHISSSPLGLTHAIALSPYPVLAAFLALSHAGIFSLLPRPPSLVASSSTSLCQLPSSTLSRFVSLFSAAMPMACDLGPFFRGQPPISRRSHVAPSTSVASCRIAGQQFYAEAIIKGR